MLNRLDVKILMALKKNEAMNAVNAMTIDEINNNNNICSRVHLDREIHKLLKEECITKGLMDRKANTYFITTKGLEVIKDA